MKTRSSGPLDATGPQTRGANKSTLRLVSWNMQGSGSNATKKAKLRMLMARKDLDGILLQECGRLDEWSEEVTKAGCHMDHEQWGEGNPRCSMAFIARFPVHCRRVPGRKKGLRPLLTTTIKGVEVTNVHGPSGGSPGYVASEIKGAAQRAMNRPFVVAGDMNARPIVLGAHLPDNIRIASSGCTTQQSGGELDYAAHHPSMSGTVKTLPLGDSDHFPIEIVMDLKTPSP